jgi:sugar lactone lactonase YvrE
VSIRQGAVRIEAESRHGAGGPEEGLSLPEPRTLMSGPVVGESPRWHDGRLLVVSGPEGLLLRREPDGSLVTHADLRGLADGWNEIVVDGRGNIYVNRPRASASAGRSSVPASSGWSRRTAGCARSPTTSRSPTAWW